MFLWKLLESASHDLEHEKKLFCDKYKVILVFLGICTKPTQENDFFQEDSVQFAGLREVSSYLFILN